jgi:hypothetical protein
MTVMYWHEVFEEVKGTKPAKVLALLYLAVLGEGYAYDMVKPFPSKNKKKKMEFNIKSFKDQSQIQPILKDLEKREFLISRIEKTDGRERRIFSLNPRILCTPDGSKIYQLPGDRVLGITEDDARKFLDKLAAEHRGQKYYLKQWDVEGISKDYVTLGIRKYDFITVLLAMQEEARVLNYLDLANKFGAYVTEIWRLENERRRIHELTCGISAYILPPPPKKTHIEGDGPK